ncbi:MAG: c-type cytochrome [Anaerolineae bacterium]
MVFSRSILAACLAAVLLAGLAWATAAYAQPAIQGTAPLQPQPAAGRQLYAQNCAPCHGQTGKGDGPTASGLNVPPTAFADYNVVAGLSFTEMFSVTKNGRMARMMPPWGSRLSDQQIWDAVGYAWTLHTSAAEVKMGRAIYEQQCASCHGPDGKGNPSAGDLTDFGRTAAISQKAWAELLAQGRGTMPAFGDKLAPAEQRAVLEYVRSLSLGPLFASVPITGTGIISGVITNGSSGQVVPNAVVELGIFDQTSLLDTRQTTADTAGFYRFTGVPTDTTFVFVARVTGPGGYSYSSEPSQFSPNQSGLNLPVTVYETTSDPSGIRVERVHFIIEFDAGRAYFTELIVFSLDGNKAYVGDGAGTVRFTVPKGAEALEINDGALGGRYIATADGFVDTMPLPPGRSSRQVLYRYEIPYTSATLELVRSLPYPAANVNVLVAEVGARVSSDQLRDQTVRQTPSGNFISLSGQNLPANQPITLRFSDLPLASPAGAGTATATGDRALLLALLAVGGLLAAALVAWPLLRRRAAPLATAGADQGALIDALARLDLAHEAGELSDAAYRDARLKLKAQLLDLMRREGRA